MNEDQAKLVIAVLLAAYPREMATQESARVYARLLSDLEFAEVEGAILQWAAERRFYPTISDIREGVFRRRLDLPEAEQAWEIVNAVAHEAPERQACEVCGGDGEVGTVACPRCNGLGDYALPRDMNPVVRRAMQNVGGSWAVKTAERPELLRRDFLKAYESFARETIRETSRESLTRAGIVGRAAGEIAREQGSLPVASD